MKPDNFDFFKDSELTEIWSERSTRQNKEQAKYICLDTKSGKQTQLFNAGDLVETTDQARFKAGLLWKVLEAWEMNGYYSYKVVLVSKQKKQTIAVLKQTELKKA